MAAIIASSPSKTSAWPVEQSMLTISLGMDNYVGLK
jgi:hypothetical protein